MTFQLIKDIRACLDTARRDGRGKMSVYGATGQPEVRANVLWDPAKGFLLVLSWLNGEEPTEEGALAIVVLFASAVRPEGGLDGLTMLSNAYEGPPGGKAMWHRTYTLPKPKPEPTPGHHPNSASQAAQAGRNDPCPCGSGRKFKKCHGGN